MLNGGWINYDEDVLLEKSYISKILYYIYSPVHFQYGSKLL